jgi:type II secretory pathway pseudopilin PulG
MPAQGGKTDNRRKRRGFSLIEALVFLFIFSVISLAFYETWILSTRHIINTKNRLGATSLANQKMEIVRNQHYDDIGTKHWTGTVWEYGIPAGDILEDEDITANSARYHVHTFIQYLDDPYDGTYGGSPNDASAADYKRVRIQVTWGAATPSETIALYSNFSPQGLETNSNTGVLALNVLDASGSGVPSASVTITNPSVSPPVSLTTQTDASGNVTLPGAKISNQTYQIIVGKSGYYAGRTYSPYPTSTFNPDNIHASVVAGSVNAAALIIDEEADLTMRSDDSFGAEIASVDYHISGGRRIGAVPGTDPAVPVYDYSDDRTTGSDGEDHLNGRSYGAYTVVPTNPSGYKFLKTVPEGPAKDQFEVSPGVDVTQRMIFMNTTINSLWVTVKSSVYATALSGATVRVTNAAASYDVSLVSDVSGFAYFPEVDTPLVAGSYDIEVTLAGHQTLTKTVGIGGNALLEETVILIPN